MSEFLFLFSNKKDEAVAGLIPLDANTFKEALEKIDKYVEEHPYDCYVERYKDKRYTIELYEYEIKNQWMVEDDD